MSAAMFFQCSIHGDRFNLPSGTGAADHVEVIAWFWRRIWIYTVHEMLEDDKTGQAADPATSLNHQLVSERKMLVIEIHKPRERSRSLLIFPAIGQNSWAKGRLDFGW